MALLLLNLLLFSNSLLFVAVQVSQLNIALIYQGKDHCVILYNFRAQRAKKINGIWTPYTYSAKRVGM